MPKDGSTDSINSPQASSLQGKGFFRPEEIEIDYAGKLGDPGEFPYTRGIHRTMYRVRNGGRLWTMRQFTGFATARETNERFKYLLERGETGLSTAFDMPTLLGFDSDNPIARADVGMGGVAVDTLRDMEKLFDGIDLRPPLSTSMTINGPAIVLLSMYFVMAQNRGIPFGELRGTIQNDALKEFIAQKEWIVPPKPSVKLIVDTIEYCARFVPQWNPISISGYHIREAGSSAAQELAFTLADGLAYAAACIERGLAVDEFAPRLSFFFDFHNNFFEEIAKVRAARRMWARFMRERFHAQNPRSLLLRTHIQTAGCALTQEQPENNIARVALQALGAVLAGTQSLHTNSYDEQLSLPSQKAVKIALRTQQIIAHETGVTEWADPLAGSYVLEHLTDAIEEEAMALIRLIDEMGGMVEAVRQGWPQAQIREYDAEYRREVESGKVAVVGQNIYNDEIAPNPDFSVPEEIQEEQIQALAQIKRERSADSVSRALTALRRAVQSGENTMPAVLEAVGALATEEEICNVFRDVYGIYYEDIRL